MRRHERRHHLRGRNIHGRHEAGNGRIVVAVVAPGAARHMDASGELLLQWGWGDWTASVFCLLLLGGGVDLAMVMVYCDLVCNSVLGYYNSNRLTRTKEQ